MLVKTLWLAVNNLYWRYWANKQFLCLGTVVWQQSNIIQQGVLCFQTSFGYKRIFVQSRKKSIFCMQYVCKVHCKYVVAHAYNIVAKIQSSSGWAFLGCAVLSATHTGFGNVLASGCCAGNFSGMATCPSKWSTLRWGLKECVSSFPFSF